MTYLYRFLSPLASGFALQATPRQVAQDAEYAELEIVFFAVEMTAKKNQSAFIQYPFHKQGIIYNEFDTNQSGDNVQP